MAKTWQAGVIGCGSVVQYLHIPGYLKCPGVKLVAICDPEPQRHEEALRMAPSLHVYNDYRTMLEAEKLDVVSVASPNCYHAEHACAALRYGAHVILEKPAAVNMKEIALIQQAVRQARRKLVVGFSHRFMRGNQKINKLVRGGAIGEPYMIRMRMAHAGPYPGWAKSDWFYSPTIARGGALLDIGIHAIDQILWHMGPVRSVQATAATLRKKIRVDDNAVLLLEFEKTNALGYLEASWTSPAGFNGIEVMGDKGCITANYTGELTLTTGRISPNMKKRPTLKTRVLDTDPKHGGWAVEIPTIIKALRRNSDLGINIDVGGAALAVALAAYESSQTGERVLIRHVR